MSGDGDSFPVRVEFLGKFIGEWDLGRGDYRAFQIGPIVEVVAIGETQGNVRVKLAASAIAVFPPEYALLFFTPEIVLPAQIPFVVSASFRASEPVGKIVIRDADGRHDVPVDQSPT